MFPDILLRFARLGLAGAVVLFAFLGYKLLSDSTGSSRVDPSCFQQAIAANKQQYSAAQEASDKAINGVKSDVNAASANYANLTNAQKYIHAAQTHFTDVDTALTNERAALGTLKSDLASCGYVPMNWTPFYVYCGLQIGLALLLFLSRFRRSAPNDAAAKARLAATVAQASQDPNITPETRLTLANAQLLLGRRDEATTNVKAALKAQPNLKLESNLRALVPTSNPSG